MYFKVLFCLFATAARLLLVFRTSILHYLTYDPFALSLHLGYGFSLMEGQTSPLEM